MDFDAVHILIGSNGKHAIIGFYDRGYKINQLYMFKNIKLKDWFPKQAKQWRKYGAKVTIRKLNTDKG